MNILKIAFSQLGIKEISGPEDNPQIVEYATETGIENINDDEVPWCSTFVNWCALKSELPKSGKANARSWISVGKQTNAPEPGDIVVFWRESIHSWKGHVAIFLGFNSDASRVYCLGGNQSNAVTIGDYNVNKVLGYRRLSKLNKMEVPEPTLKQGDNGKEVLKLQAILNHLQYNCGDLDSDFGPKVLHALKLFQSNNRLSIDGVYGNQSKNTIEALLQE